MSSYKTNAFTYASIVALGSFIFGLDAAVISGTVRYIAQEFSLSDLQIGTAVGASGFSVMLALPIAGYASNRFGRKKTLQTVALLYLLSAVFSTLAPTFITLVAARFLGGFAFCSLSLASMYIGEIAPPKWRGKLVSMNQINIVVGLSAAYFLNYLILKASASGAVWVENLGINQHTWRWMFGTEILPAFAWFGLLFFIPESPSWLVYSKQNDSKVMAVLRKVLPENEIAAHIKEMKDSLLSGLNRLSMGAQLKEIIGKPMRITLLIGVTIACVQQGTGINAILFYAPTVFEQLGIGTDAAFMQAVWIGVTSIIFTVLALLLIDKIGRRRMIIGGLVWILISLSICSVAFSKARYELSEQALSELHEIPNADRLQGLTGTEYTSDVAFKQALKEVLGSNDARDYSSVLLEKAAKMRTGLILAGILSFIAAFQFSVGPIMWVLFSEIFPISLRGVAIPMFALITSVLSYLIQQFFPWQLSTMGSSSIFMFYAVIVLAGLIVLYRYLPETKNLSIEEIQLAFKKKRKRIKL